MATPRSVLFHAYHFPPLGGPGVQRPARMVRHLRDLGYEPRLLTGPGGGSDEWTPPDPTLLAEVPADVVVHRVSGPEPVDGRLQARAERWLRLPAPWTRWWIGGSLALAREVGRDVDVVYSWMQPYASARAGAAIARALGKPWVADFGDAWAFDEMIVYPSAAHRALERARMRRVLAAASVVVTSTDEAAERFRRLLGTAGPRVVTIPNGFEADDFAGPAPARDDEVFRIVHTGFLHTGLGERYQRFGTLRQLLRGGVDGVDVLARSHVFLVEAIRRLLARRPDLTDRVELHLIGAASDADERAAGGNDFIKMTGYVPHETAVTAVRSADLLFLPMHDLETGARATLVPGKTYEYLASGTPILAAVPAGDARDLLERAGNATICAPKDVSAMADALEQHIRRKMAGGEVPAARQDVVAQYEYRRLARRLADALDEAVSLGAASGR